MGSTQSSPSSCADGNSPAAPGSCGPWRGSKGIGKYQYDCTQVIGSFPKGSTEQRTKDNAVGECAEGLKRKGITITEEDQRLMKAQRVHDCRDLYTVKSAIGRDNNTPQTIAVQQSADVQALKEQVASLTQKMAQYEPMLRSGACKAKRNILETALHGIFRAAEATTWNPTTKQTEVIPYSDACINWNFYLDHLKPDEVGRLRASGSSADVVRETRKGTGLSYSVLSDSLSEAVHYFDRDLARGAMVALQLDGQPLWDHLFSLACREADVKEIDVREHRRSLFELLNSASGLSEQAMGQAGKAAWKNGDWTGEMAQCVCVQPMSICPSRAV